MLYFSDSWGSFYGHEVGGGQGECTPISGQCLHEVLGTDVWNQLIVENHICFLASTHLHMVSVCLTLAWITSCSKRPSKKCCSSPKKSFLAFVLILRVPLFIFLFLSYSPSSLYISACALMFVSEIWDIHTQTPIYLILILTLEKRQFYDHLPYITRKPRTRTVR